MEIQEYLDKMKEIQNLLLDFIDDEVNDQEKFNKLIKLFKDQKIQDDKQQLKSLIILLASIVDHHYRTINFFEKIFKIILYYKDQIKKYYTNLEIFYFFQNKKIILYLFNEKILDFDKSVVSELVNNYELDETKIYLFPELCQFLDEKTIRRTKIPENLEKHRDVEYYDHKILQLIQKDLINEFIEEISKIDFKLDESIEVSPIFETNSFLQCYDQKPIEYAAFFGSIKIFKYLVVNNCELEQYIWFKAIHGRNPEIIHILEDKKIEPEDFTYKELFAFAIECHHNEIADYIFENYVSNEEEENDISSFISKKALRYYNFSYIESKFINSSNFYEICKRKYCILAEALLRNDKSIDINMLISNETVDKYYQTPIKTENTVLFSAVQRRNSDIVHLLLENKDIDVNKKSLRIDHRGEKKATPLLAAINKGYFDIVKILLEHQNIDVNLKSEVYDFIKTPLYVAIEESYRHPEIAMLLIKRNDVDINLRSHEHYDYFIDEGMSIFTKDVTPLYKATIDCSNLEIMKLLLERKDIDINAIINVEEERLNKTGNVISYTDESALYIAVNMGKKENAILLASQGNVDVNFKAKVVCDNKIISETPLLQEAIDHKMPEVVKLLLENKNINVDIKISEPKEKPDPKLWTEENIKSQILEIQKEIVDADYIGTGFSYFLEEKTIFYFAVEQDNAEIVKYLLGNENIDVNAKLLYKSYTYFIEKFRKEEEIKKLKEMTPLYLAVKNNNYEIVKLLVENEKVDVNMKSTVYSWESRKLFNKEKQPCENEVNEENENDEDIIENESIKNNGAEEETKKDDAEEEENNFDDVDIKEEENHDDDENRYEIEEEKEGEIEVDKEETALHEAITKGNLNIIKLLLRNANIDVDVTDKQGKKPVELSDNKDIIALFNQ